MARKPTQNQLTLLRLLYATQHGFGIAAEFWHPSYADDVRKMEALEKRGWLQPRPDKWSRWANFTPEGLELALAEYKLDERKNYLTMLRDEHPSHSEDPRDTRDCPLCPKETA